MASPDEVCHNSPGSRPETSAPAPSCQQSFERLIDAVTKLHRRIDRLEVARTPRRPLARPDDGDAATILILDDDSV